MGIVTDGGGGESSAGLPLFSETFSPDFSISVSGPIFSIFLDHFHQHPETMGTGKIFRKKQKLVHMVSKFE